MVMLKGIPACISPELMSVMLSMGHGDELVIADGNFPAASHAQRLVRADGLGVPELLDAIMKFFPLDTYVKNPVAVMGVVPGDTAPNPPPIWAHFTATLKKEEGDWVELEQIDRFAFYERAKKAYAIVATSETAIYANIILKKGVVKPKH
eukprot:Phypoly_transcript_23119.p1 GENE.Phypoly_transcript_23119~~Phypoly_transcript_23119.p1  ORF type:complete len:150 (+),score=30.44 Phypoly_transcript_23119:99-548(+)